MCLYSFIMNLIKKNLCVISWSIEKWREKIWSSFILCSTYCITFVLNSFSVFFVSPIYCLIAVSVSLHISNVHLHGTLLPMLRWWSFFSFSNKALRQDSQYTCSHVRSRCSILCATYAIALSLQFLSIKYSC